MIVSSICIIKDFGNKAEITRELELGNKYLNELDYEQAIISFEVAIQIDTKNEEAYLGLAKAYVAQENLDSAIKVLEDGIEVTDSQNLIDYLEDLRKKKDNDSQNPDNPENFSENAGEAANNRKVDLSNAVVGGEVTFGAYEQDNDLSNGPEPIEWYVLDIKDGKAFLMSKYVLEANAYHPEDTPITWEQCNLRKWLNDDFYNSAFDSGEQRYIQETKLVNEDNGGTDGGNDTVDKVFLLSKQDIKHYFNYDYLFCSDVNDDQIADNDFNSWNLYVNSSNVDNAEMCTKCTPYALINGGFTYSNLSNKEDENSIIEGGQHYIGNTSWWLRTPGYYQNAEILFVDYAGRLCGDCKDTYSFAYCALCSFHGARPAIWVELDD